MDAASEKILQEALHPRRRTERIWLEPDGHDEGGQGLHFQGSMLDNIVRLTPPDLEELTDLLIARRIALAAGLGPDSDNIDRVLRLLKDEG
jgi:hypothetical protein